MNSWTVEELDNAVARLAVTISGHDLADFFNRNRVVTTLVNVIDQKNKTVFILALVNFNALIFDDTEEEFGLAQYHAPSLQVDHIELIGDLQPTILELFQRITHE